MLKIRGISGIQKLDDVKVPLTHPATGEVVGHLFGNVKNFETHRVAFFSNSKDMRNDPFYRAFLKQFCTGWDFVNDETGEPLTFSSDAVCEFAGGVNIDWIGAAFFDTMNDIKNFYSKPNKT